MNEKLEELREKRQEKVTGIMRYFNLAMGLFYVIAGSVTYFYPFIENVEEWAKVSISLILVFYGVFRIWRALKS